MKFLKTSLILFVFFISKFAHAQNYAVSLDGTNDYVAIPSTIFSTTVSTLTIECWIKPNSGSFNSTYHAVVGYDNGVITDRNPGLWINNGVVHYDMYEPSTNTRSTGNTAAVVIQDKWNHIAMVKAGTSLKIYVNGKLELTATVTNNVKCVGNYRIGYNDNYFSGLVDEVRFWSTARTQQEILNYLYKSPAYNATGLLAMYKMNAGTGTTAINSCTNTTNNSGTLTNGPTWSSSPSVAFSPNAISLGATNDYLQADITSAGSTAVTLECWVKFINITGQQNFLGMYQGMLSTNYCRMIPYKTSGNYIDCYFANTTGTASYTTSSYAVTAGTWYHMAFVYNNNKSYVYVNGVLQSSNTSAVAYSMDGADVLVMGADRSGGNLGFNSDVVLDEVRVWTVARTGAQIAEYMDKYVPSNTAGLAAYYNFDQGNPGSTNTDISQFYNSSVNGNLFGTSLSMSGTSSNLISQGSALSTNYTWTGNTSTAFATTTNWSEETVPLSSANIEIISSPLNAPTLDQNRTIGDLILPSGTKFTLNGYTLTIDGKLSGTGTFVGGGNSSLGFLTNYSAATLYLDQTTNKTTNSLVNLSFNMGLGASVTLGNPVFVTSLFDLTAGTLTTGGNLTLRSTSAGSAMTTNMEAATLSGNVNVERYIPGRRAFRLISSPVSTTTTIYSNWQEGGSNTSGLGTHITGSATGSNGFDATTSGNPSLFTLDNATSTWNAVTSTNNATTDKLTAGNPYRLMVRGDRTVSLTAANATATNTTLRATGTLYSGNKVFSGLNTSAGGFSLVGNPYQASIDMNTLLSSSTYNTNLNAVYYYIWDPTVGTRGAYVTVDVTSNSNNVSGSKANKYLQPWQACFVKTKNAGSASFTFAEAAKNTTSTATWKETFDIPRMSVNIYQTDSLNNGQMPLDGLQIRFKDNYSPLLDDYDAVKPINQDENFSVFLENSKLSIECRNVPENSDTIQFLLEQTRHTDYTLKFEPTNINGIDFMLWDDYLKQSTPLSRFDVSYYRFQLDAQNSASKASNRFSLMASAGMASVADLSASHFKLVPNPGNGKIAVLNNAKFQIAGISVFNMEGQRVFEKNNNPSVLDISHLPTGMYLIEITDQNSHKFREKYLKRD